MLTLLAIFVSANTVALKFQSAKALFVFNVSSSMRLLFSATGMKHYRAAPVPTEINFPRYNMKCSVENVILRGIVHEVSCFPLHFMHVKSRKFGLLFLRCRVLLLQG